jgi:hypothetical protein
VLASSALFLGLRAAPARADDSKVAAPRVEGFAPDAQLVGGGGFGLGGPLSNYFLGRLRLGALYAREPWIANAGVSIEVGALGEFGVGCELELNTWKGLFAQIGFASVTDHQWMGHVALGYTVLGLEWQHRFGDATTHDALLFEVRLPLGTWWFLVGNKTADRTVASVRKAQPTPVGPQPTAAVIPAADQPEAPLTLSPAAPAPPSAADKDEARQLLAEAQQASARGEYAQAAAALQRAYQRIADPQLLLQLAEAERAQGKLRAAAQELRHFLAVAPAGEGDEQAKLAAQHKLEDVERRIAHLRLELRGARGDERVELDGALEPAALLGYDVPLDPGDHELVLRRADQPLSTRSFHAGDGELVRLALDASPP